MLYTSKESWDYVEFRFSKKKYDLLEKKWFNFDFSDFSVKIEADQMPSKRNFSKFWKNIQKMDLLGPVRHWKEQSHVIWTHLDNRPRNHGQKTAGGGSLNPPRVE